MVNKKCDFIITRCQCFPKHGHLDDRIRLKPSFHKSFPYYISASVHTRKGQDFPNIVASEHCSQRSGSLSCNPISGPHRWLCTAYNVMGNMGLKHFLLLCLHECSSIKTAPASLVFRHLPLLLGSHAIKYLCTPYTVLMLSSWGTFQSPITSLDVNFITKVK